MTSYVFDMVEKTVGKGENTQHFLLYLQCFQKAFFFFKLKSGKCGKELIILQRDFWI